jgi:peptidyl-prolyl cis-trans isomerase SurA
MIRFALLFGTLLIMGCGASRSLGTIEDEPITLQEFEDLFARNNGGWENAAKSNFEERKAFFDRFIAYKLKLREAKTRQLLQDSTVQRELQEYKSSIALTYIFEKELVTPALQALYERRKEELRTSHILLRFPPFSSPGDTLETFELAMSLTERARISPFDSLARAYSQDPGSRTNGGDLGWLTQGRMASSFEDALYALQPGEITKKPVRTDHGYHIIKLIAREPHKGTIQVSHILKRFAQNKQDSSAVQDTTQSIYNMIQRGDLSFENAAKVYSDDASSREKGGAIGSFARSRMAPDLVPILFSMPVGSISAPYRAPYGYHIFKVTGADPFPAFQELEAELRQTYQEHYFRSDHDRYIRELKMTYRLEFDEIALTQLVNSFDTTKTPSSEGWASGIDPTFLSRPFSRFAGQVLTVGDFLESVQSGEEFRTISLTPANVEHMINRIVDSKILKYHASQAVQRYPAFADLMKEYENGILVYRLDQDEIWRKMELSDSALRAFYEQTKDEYRWGDRIAIAEIHVRSDSLARSLHDRVLRGEDFGDLAAEHTVRPGFNEARGKWGLTSVYSNELTIKGDSMTVGAVSKPFRFENGWSIIKVLEKESSRIKTFDEAYQEISGRYQEHKRQEREQRWIEELKKKYRVTIYLDQLSHAFTRPPAS